MPRCKNCKTTFLQYEFNNKFCKKVDCQYQKWVWIKEEQKAKEKKAWNQRKAKAKEEDETHPQHLRKTEQIFNTYIRKRDKEKGCVSCGKKFGVKEKFDAGHFHPVSTSPSIRFNEDNVHAQCVNCNRDKHGNLHEYRFRLINRIGIERVEDIDRLRHGIIKYTIYELKELQEIYKQKVKEIGIYL